MSKSQQKVLQYLTEAHAHELGLVRVLQSQIAMTPRGTYRTALETHLGETRDHAKRVAARADALGRRSDPLSAIVDLAGWQRLDEYEQALGTDSGRPRVKVSDRDQQVKVASGG